MATIKTSEIITDALETLTVLAEEAKIPQGEANAAIRALNDMMLMWQVQGIDIGYTQVTNMGDDITVPLGAVLGMKANLALTLAPKYNIEPSAVMIRNALIGYTAIVDMGTTVGPMSLPSTLPQGSGNYDSDTFYPDQSGTILTESGGSIALESDTEEG